MVAANIAAQLRGEPPIATDLLTGRFAELFGTDWASAGDAVSGGTAPPVLRSAP